MEKKKSELTRRTRLAGGDATLLSSQRRISPTRDERHNQRRSGPYGPTATKRVSSPPDRDHLHGVGHHRHPRIQTASHKAIAPLTRRFVPTSAGRRRFSKISDGCNRPCEQGRAVRCLAANVAGKRRPRSRLSMRNNRRRERSADTVRPAPLGRRKAIDRGNFRIGERESQDVEASRRERGMPEPSHARAVPVTAG